MTKDNKFVPRMPSLAITANEFRLLQEENFRLKALLKQHGISWEEDEGPIEESCVPPLEQSIHLSTDQKVALSDDFFVVERTFTQRGGNQQREELATPLSVAMNGRLACAISLK